MSNRTARTAITARLLGLATIAVWLVNGDVLRVAFCSSQRRPHSFHTAARCGFMWVHWVL